MRDISVVQPLLVSLDLNCSSSLIVMPQGALLSRDGYMRYVVLKCMVWCSAWLCTAASLIERDGATIAVIRW